MQAQVRAGVNFTVATADPKPTSLIPPAISPARESENYRVKQTGTRLTEAEFAEVEAAAADEGTNISAWIREAILARLSAAHGSKTDPILLAELMAIRSLILNLFAAASKGPLTDESGSGKSSAIRQILRQIAERGETAIVYDPALEFTPEFYSPERGDLILNPLDTRCPYWDIADELSTAEVATAMAAALFPEKDHEKEFFTAAPRRIFARLMCRRPTPQQLVQWMSDPAEIARMVQGTPYAAFLDSSAPAQSAGIISSFNMIADSFELLPREDDNRQRFVLVRAKPWLTGSDRRDRLLCLGGGVGCGGKVGQPVDGAIGEAGQHVCQVLANGNAQFAAALYDAEDGGDLGSGLFAAQVQPIPPSNRNRDALNSPPSSSTVR